MATLFVDTSGFIAAFDSNDPAHADVSRQWSDMARRGDRLRDPKLSFCDVSSFAVMREHGIRQVVTLDRHFREAGFEMRSESAPE